MSCITLTDPHSHLLASLTQGPRKVDDLNDRDNLDEIRRWL